MVIKPTPQLLKRISIRWLPKEAYENTDTIALNVGGYYMDLRVVTADNSLEWSRAGERKIIEGQIPGPATFQWTRMIDSLGSTQIDEAAFVSLPDGNDLETGTFNMDGTPLPYEEVWRDVTDTVAKRTQSSWIIQSNDGSIFLGRIGNIFLGMRGSEKDGFLVRRESYSEETRDWATVYEGSAGSTREVRLPKAEDTVRRVEKLSADGMTTGSRIELQDIPGFEDMNDWTVRGWES